MADVIPSTRWLRAKIGRLSAGEEGTCACKGAQHQAPYRAQVVDATTGLVVEALLCTNRAAAWADRHGLTFPPGMWAKDAHEPGKPPQVFEIPEGTEMATCSSCRANIKWIETAAGKRMPVDLDGVSHFVTCPNRDQHRKRT